MSDPELLSQRPSVLGAIVRAAALVGVLDGTDAVVFFGLRGVSAQRIFQHIASAVLGRGSFAQGGVSVGLGVVFHFGVALGLTTTFFLLVRWLPGLARRWFWSGVAYGMLSYAAMNYLVLPMTRVARPGGIPPWPVLTNGVLAHVFCVGVPIAWLAARYVRAAAKR